MTFNAPAQGTATITLTGLDIDTTRLFSGPEYHLQVENPNDGYYEKAYLNFVEENSGTYTFQVGYVEGIELGAFDEGQTITVTATSISFIYQAASENYFAGVNGLTVVFDCLDYEQTVANKVPTEQLEDGSDIAALITYAKSQGWIN